ERGRDHLGQMAAAAARFIVQPWAAYAGFPEVALGGERAGMVAHFVERIAPAVELDEFGWMLVGDLSALGDRTAAQRPDLAQLRVEPVEIGGVEQPAHLKLQVGIDIVPVKSDCALEFRVVDHGRVSRCGRAPEIPGIAPPRSIQKLLARVQAVHWSAGFAAPRLLLELAEI